MTKVFSDGSRIELVELFLQLQRSSLLLVRQIHSGPVGRDVVDEQSDPLLKMEQHYRLH